MGGTTAGARWADLSEPDRAAAVGRCAALAVAVDGRFVRACRPYYANRRDLLTGEGSRLFGGRWNPPGLATVYASRGAETALAEATGLARSFGWSEADVLPLTLVALRCRLGRVLSLIEGPATLDLLGFAPADLSAEWRGPQDLGGEPATQALGRLACSAGFEGLLVPSARRPGGVNLVVFPDRLLPGSLAAILRPEELASPAGL